MLYITPLLDGFKLNICESGTKKAQLFKETLILSEKFPEIVENIQLELDAHALQKNKRV